VSSPPTPPPAPTVTPAVGRCLIALAAFFWSLSGLLTKLLTRPTILGLDDPPIQPLQIAFGRVFFAGVLLLPTLRRRDLSFQPAMLGMAVTFALMNALYVSAMALGSAANAVLLQYTAPIWMFVAAVWLLGEPADRRGLQALVIGLAGVAVIVAGNWEPAGRGVIVMALGSGVTYAGVLIFLRLLRTASPRWLTVINCLGGALALLPWVVTEPLPSWSQLAFLAFFGGVQLGLPYWLMAKGLRGVSPQEAGTITLLEPILNPLWVVLVLPGTETPSTATLVGGALVLAALAWRYAPRGRSLKGASK
jgi:drug/metabolite transporter (DMT)-like permease